jgi:hypothetical protein
VTDFSLEPGIMRPVTSKILSRLGVTSNAHPLAWLSPMMRTLCFLLALVLIFLTSVFSLTSSF